jgi:hypothetical protein
MNSTKRTLFLFTGYQMRDGKVCGATSGPAFLAPIADYSFWQAHSTQTRPEGRARPVADLFDHECPGLVINSAGMFLMSVAAYCESLFGVLGATMVIAVGFVPVVLTTTGLIVGSAPPEKSGSASAISETSAELDLCPRKYRRAGRCGCSLKNAGDCS